MTRGGRSPPLRQGGGTPPACGKGGDPSPYGKGVPPPTGKAGRPPLCGKGGVRTLWQGGGESAPIVSRGGEFPTLWQGGGSPPSCGEGGELQPHTFEFQNHPRSYSSSAAAHTIHQQPKQNSNRRTPISRLRDSYDGGLVWVRSRCSAGDSITTTLSRYMHKLNARTSHTLTSIGRAVFPLVRLRCPGNPSQPHPEEGPCRLYNISFLRSNQLINKTRFVNTRNLVFNNDAHPKKKALNKWNLPYSTKACPRNKQNSNELPCSTTTMFPKRKTTARISLFNILETNQKNNKSVLPKQGIQHQKQAHRTA